MSDSGPSAPTSPPPTSPRAASELAPLPPWLVTLAALSCLAVIGFSVSIFFQSRAIVQEKGVELLLSNQLGTPARNRVLLVLALSTLVLPALGAVYLLVRRLTKRPDGGEDVALLARLGSPLLLAGFLPALFTWQFAQRSTLAYLLLLTLFVVFMQALLGVSMNAWAELAPRPALSWVSRAAGWWRAHLPGWLPLFTVLSSAAAYATFTGYFTIQQHRHILTSAFDLGIYDNVLYNAYAGTPFHSPVLYGPNDVNYLASHSEYGMLLFLPFYAIRPGAETLLIIQAVMLGFAALPLFLFARTRLSPWAAVVVSLGYLLFAPLHGPAFYDFHWLPLAIFFHFWMYFALATHRTKLAVLCVLVLFALREDIAVGLAIFGFFLALTGARVRFGLALGVLSVVWFGVNKFVIMPSFGTWWFDNMYSELFADSKSSYGSVFRTLLSNPVYSATTFVREQKLVYVFHMLAPLAFLPARRFALVPLLLPGAFFTLLTTGYWPTVSIAFQYTTHWIPYLFLATVLSLSLLRRGEGGAVRQRAAIGTLCFSLLSHSYAFGAILQRESFVGGFGQIDFRQTPAQAKRYEGLQQVLSRIPREASVAATEYLNPHISARRLAYCFRYELPVVDYILVSSYEVVGDNRRLLKNLVTRADYKLETHVEDFYLFKRGTPDPSTETALRSLGVSR